MKKLISIAMSVFLFAGLLVFTGGKAYAEGEKIGYVDLAKVFDEYQKTKDFDKSLEAKGAGKQAERDKMVAEVKKLRDEAELLTGKAKEDKQAGVDDKIKALQEFDRTTRDALRKERDGMVRDILKEIETVIQTFGKNEGYTYIFNDRVIVFKTGTGDLTAQVIKALNDSYKKQ